MFLVGVAGLVALLLLPMYERAIAGIAALAIVAVVLAGFLAHPRQDVFYVRTTVTIGVPDDVAWQHDCIAVRVEVTRLWLLFVPTFLAVGLLTVAATERAIWDFTFLGRLWEAGPYLLGRALLLIVWGIVSTWVSERWVLHEADAACNANSVQVSAEEVSYSFVDRSGEYYGGHDFAFGLTRPAQLASIVLYKQRKPQRNKIAMACFFHRLIVIGRGLTDLDGATVAAHRPVAVAE